jgi:peptidoglycan hydrolase-like protein with peptidoglycan-binding domain
MASSEDTLVSLIQFALEELGFDPGPADGKLGPRTTAAIEAYQRSHDLQAEGQPTEQLLEHMEKRLNITD